MPKGGKRIYTPSAGGGGAAGATAAQVTWGPEFGGAKPKQEARMSLARQTAQYELGQEARVAATQRPAYFVGKQEAKISGPQHSVSYKAKQEAKFTALSYTISELFCRKDSYVGTALTVGVCEDTANHDGESLVVSPSSLLSGDLQVIFIGFDFSGLSTAYTITSAQLSLNPTTLSTGQIEASTLTFRGIAAADEGWAENTIVCSNAPAAAGQTMTVGVTTAGSTAIDVTTFKTTMKGRFGTTSFTFRISRADVGVTNFWGCHDRSSAGGTPDTRGPRLRLVLTAPST